MGHFIVGGYRLATANEKENLAFNCIDVVGLGRKKRLLSCTIIDEEFSFVLTKFRRKNHHQGVEEEELSVSDTQLPFPTQIITENHNFPLTGIRGCRTLIAGFWFKFTRAGGWWWLLTCNWIDLYLFRMQ